MHVSGQVIVCPHLFVALPHAFPLHAAVLSGVQHVSSGMHTPALGHVAEQLTLCAQLFFTVVLQCPAHAVVLSSGVQHALPTHTSDADGQLTVPPLPQGTCWPQLLVAEPHVLPAHVVDTGAGTQPHAPLLHVSPPWQPPHEMVWPQSSTVMPQRFWHQTEGGVGEQHVPFAVQTAPSAHCAGQATASPQLFVTVVPHLPAHAAALSGVQHVPSAMQTSPEDEHEVPPVGPHPTSCPQLFLAVPQFFPEHVFVAGSGTQPHAPEVHVRPASQPPHVTGLPQLSYCGPQRLAQKCAMAVHASSVVAPASGTSAVAESRADRPSAAASSPRGPRSEVAPVHAAASAPHAIKTVQHATTRKASPADIVA
jgi:hypothetical protein